MSKISVSVTDGTNVNLTVSPRSTQTITVSRGSATQGTVTNVTANTPLSVTNGTTTPDLSISQANESNAGYLTAGDWSTFNSKVSTVSGTAPVTVTGTANAIVSMAAATDSVSGYLTSTDHATFNAKVGSITSTDGSIAVTGTTTRDLIVNHSPNVLVEVRNNTGATLTKGTAVYINGAIGQLPTITKAQANTDAASAQTLGLMTTDLANNSNGYVTIIGLITNINTSAYTDGQQLYLSPTIAGGLTATKPSAPQHLVYVAVVEHAHITQGKLFVKVQNGYELDELHDVQIVSPTNGQTLTYDSATSLWKNTTPTSGGVTSVTATSPVQSTGGTTPVISMPAATTSTSGYLTSTDWNTFNNKQAAGSYLTTVTADSPLTGSGTSASHLSIPVATTSANGYLSSTDWTTFNNKQTSLVSGTNIKTVNSTSLLGSGDVSVGTVTSVGGTGTVSGISLSGTVTSTGNLTLGGSLNLSSPPAIGGTTPSTVTGTTVSATTQITLPTITVGNLGVGVLQMVDGLDGYDYLTMWTDGGGSTQYGVGFPGGINTPFINGVINFTASGAIIGGSYQAIYNSPNAGSIQLDGDISYVKLQAPTGAYVATTLTLPNSTGSANQVLKTDGSGNLSWTTVDPLTLTGISDPTAPTGTNTTVYSKSFGGYPTLAARNALNKSFGLQSALWSKNIQMWTCTNSSAGAWINQSPASSGTFTAVTPTTGSTLYQTIRRSTYANVITITNQVLGVNGTYLSFFRGSVAGQGGFFFYTRCGFDVWTNGGRFFAGMALNNTTIVSNDPSSNNNTVGFCVDAADNGAISFLTRGTAATKASTGYTITSNKGYELYIYCAPNSSQYTWMIVDINAGTSATGTATNNLPTNTQTQQPTVLASNAALTAATAISLGIAKIYCESDY